MMLSCTIAMTQNLENKRMENRTFHAAGVMTVS
jgi:hypothetical protein